MTDFYRPVSPIYDYCPINGSVLPTCDFCPIDGCRNFYYLLRKVITTILLDNNNETAYQWPGTTGRTSNNGVVPRPACAHT